METISFKNYRCIEDSGEISLKPITFLLGANSTGKSSVLKFFPLLKQTIDRKVNGTFLWNEQGSLVDFMSFTNVLTKGKDHMEVRFTVPSMKFVTSAPIPDKNISNVDVSMSIAFKEKNDDFFKEIRFKYSGFEILIKFKSAKEVEIIKINELEFSEVKMSSTLTNSLFPRLLFHNQADVDEDLPDKYLREWASHFIKNAEMTEIRHLVYRLYRHIHNYNSLRSQIKLLRNKDDLVSEERLCEWFMLFYINELIDSINLYILEFAKHIHYIQPLRAITERFYRYSTHSVDELDSDGKNLPMFFNSLSPAEMRDFNKWLYSIFKVHLKLKKHGGFVELMIKERNKDPRNMVDMGFGYTQILPILTLIWHVAILQSTKKVGNIRKGRFCQEHIIAIEQPELHLHPRYQGLFAKFLVKVIKYCRKQNLDLRFIIETHSEYIINQLGELISDKKCDSSDVNILLFNALNEGKQTYIEQVKYNEKGHLVNWPYDFFTHYVD